MFVSHPSRRLHDLFAHKAYQGAPPHEADFLFVGLDANYDADIETQPVFPLVCEYHLDGISFWRKYGKHHPFLMPRYSGKGRKYHESIARIGFTPEHADAVSFVELVSVPTVGSNPKIEPGDLSPSHLVQLDLAIREGKARHVFVSDTVARLMRRTRAFSWLKRSPVNWEGPFAVLFRSDTKTVYLHLHLSQWWGKNVGRAEHELAGFRTLVRGVQQQRP